MSDLPELIPGATVRVFGVTYEVVRVTAVPEAPEYREMVHLRRPKGTARMVSIRSAKGWTNPIKNPFD